MPTSLYWRSAGVNGVHFDLMAINWSYWRSFRNIGVHPELMAFNSFYWRSSGDNGVQFVLLAFNWSYWRSARDISVHPVWRPFPDATLQIRITPNWQCKIKHSIRRIFITTCPFPSTSIHASKG
ncbi:hypothetical protein [Sporosarcina cyprini]|uniref:hypothetical protein n=1 Tax=Sporosarcina cyprini TaxID=2910523 RepID=UPI001EDD1EF0|nr:hypothetical protein [Sporosarcina cyprini]MCG3087474.1 hypothetical protein [Sporosarcina cyprini]